MTFKCNQNPDTMEDRAGGKYCVVCSKTLLDFTEKSHAEFKEMTANGETVCGIFYEEQVNELYGYEVELKRPLMFFGALAALLGLPAGAAHAQEETKPPTVHVIPVPGDTSDATDDHNYSSGCKNAGDPETVETVGDIKKKKRYRYGIFFRRSFPFIAFRRPLMNRLVGWYSF